MCQIDIYYLLENLKAIALLFFELLKKPRKYNTANVNHFQIICHKCANNTLFKKQLRSIYNTYHPLKGHAVNCRPPQSNIMLATAGRAYHFKLSLSIPVCL